jgi:hypothetical protein
MNSHTKALSLATRGMATHVVVKNHETVEQDVVELRFQKCESPLKMWNGRYENSANQKAKSLSILSVERAGS